MLILEESTEQIINRFMTFRTAEGVSDGSIQQYTRILKNFLEFIHPKSFQDVIRSDIEHYLADWAQRDSFIKKSTKVSTNYLNLIRTVLKYFFKWLYETDDYPEVVKWIKIRRIHREIDPRDILSEEEIYKLIRGAPTIRDKALIHTLYESGARLNEIHERNVGDLSFEQVGDTNPILAASLFIPSRGIGVGKEKGKYLRLVDSAIILQEWLTVHPNPEPDQPLWVSLHSNFGSRLGRNTIRDMLKRVARQCEITKPVNPHAFRHAQVTASAKYLSDQQLKQKFGWTPGSDMLRIYSHLTDQDVATRELEVRGIQQVKDTSKRILINVKCEQCGRVYSAGKRICDCGRPLDPALASRYDLKKQEAEQSLYSFAQFVTGLNPKKREALLDFMKELKGS